VSILSTHTHAGREDIGGGAACSQIEGLGAQLPPVHNHQPHHQRFSACAVPAELQGGARFCSQSAECLILMHHALTSDRSYNALDLPLCLAERLLKTLHRLLEPVQAYASIITLLSAIAALQMVWHCQPTYGFSAADQTRHRSGVKRKPLDLCL